jgi:hypothetical protein
MSGLEAGPVLALVGLGALHGVNPAMGWLFAVALGLQERSARAVWRALPPLALGHALSVAAFAAAAALAGAVLSGAVLRGAMAALLIGVGAHRLLRGHVHLRYGGMRVNRRQLVVWSFLMATAHGAGLMVLPFVPLSDRAAAVALPAASSGHAAHAAHAHGVAEPLHGGVLAGQTAALLASLVHTLSYLAVAGLLAVIVYTRVGVRLLRTAWINLDAIWAFALIATGVVLLALLGAG